MIRVDFELEADDTYDYMEYMLRENAYYAMSRRAYNEFLAQMIVLWALAFGGSVLLISGSGLPSFIAGAAVGGLIGAANLWRLGGTNGFVRRSIEQHRRLVAWGAATEYVGSASMVFEDLWLEVEYAAEGIRSKISWDRVSSVIRTERQLIIMFRPEQGLFIPRRAFESNDMEEEVLQFIGEHVPSEPSPS